jgi:hypothetical protein
MISLKKNDKIIIIVAIVIIIIAGVGIAMYQSPETSSSYPTQTMTGEQTYEVKWMLRNGSVSTISEFADKTKPYEGNITLPAPNIEKIMFNLSWTDDHMTLFKRRGLDTLYLAITLPNGYTSTTSNTSAPKTGYGSIVELVSLNIIPPVKQFQANNTQDAQSKLQEYSVYDDSFTGKDIHFNVSVQIGELRFLKKMRDKGNSFDLSVTYQYYEASVKQAGNTTTTGLDDGTTVPENPWDNIVTPPYISMIISTGCGRFV